MVKKSRTPHRGIQPGIQRHKILSRPLNQTSIFGIAEQLISSQSLQRFYTFSENCFYFYADCSCSLCLVPLSVSTVKGRLEPASTKERILHYFMLTLLTVSMLHKLGVSVYMVMFEPMDATTFMSVATFLACFVSLTASASSIFRSDVAIDLLAGWPQILACYPQKDGRVLGIVSNTKTAIVVSGLAVLGFVIGIGISMFSLILPSLLVCFLPLAEHVGLVSKQSQIPRIVWALVFWPLEILTYLLPMFVSGFSTMTLMIMAMVIRTCTEQLR